MKKLTILIVLCFSIFTILGQEENDTTVTIEKVKITMKNGAEYEGEIVSKDDNETVLLTENGKMILKTSNIKNVKLIDVNQKFKFENPNGTRYFFGPSGIPMKKGMGYYQNVLVTLNFANYGVTRHFSIGGGFEFISTVLKQPVWFLTPKLGHSFTDNLHLSAGAITATLKFDAGIALPYASFTVGTPDLNLSVGGGYFMAYAKDGEITIPDNNIAIMLSGTWRVNNSLAFLSENYYIPQINKDIYFGIHGLRILSNLNSFDVGVITIPEIMKIIPVLPYVGYVRTFGKERKPRKNKLDK